MCGGVNVAHCETSVRFIAHPQAKGGYHPCTRLDTPKGESYSYAIGAGLSRGDSGHVGGAAKCRQKNGVEA